MFELLRSEEIAGAAGDEKPETDVVLTEEDFTRGQSDGAGADGGGGRGDS